MDALVCRRRLQLIREETSALKEFLSDARVVANVAFSEAFDGQARDKLRRSYERWATIRDQIIEHGREHGCSSAVDSSKRPGRRSKVSR